MTDEMLLNVVEDFRVKNNRLWMDLVRLAVEASPVKAKGILRKITANDKDIAGLMKRLSE